MKKLSPFLKKLGLGLLWAIWVCGVLLLIQFGLSFLLSKLFSILPFRINPPTLAQAIFTILSYFVSFAIIFFIPPKLIKKIKKSTLSELGLNELPTWTDIGLSFVGLFVYLLLAAFLTSIFSTFPWFNATEAQDVGFDAFLVPVDRIIAYIILGVIAPIAEEIIFRGFLYQKIKSLFFKANTTKQSDKSQKTKDKSLKKRERVAILIATLITSLAFGIMHGQWNVGVNVFAMSIVLCLLREITGSIYAGILLHIIKNTIAFYLLYLAMFNF